MKYFEFKMLFLSEFLPNSSTILEKSHLQNSHFYLSKSFPQKFKQPLSIIRKTRNGTICPTEFSFCILCIFLTNRENEFLVYFFPEQVYKSKVNSRTANSN